MMSRLSDHHFTTPREYQGWAIDFVYPPIPYRGWDWQSTHPNYEPGHSGHVSGASISEVMHEIDLWIEENGSC